MIFPIFKGEWPELVMLVVLFLTAKYTWNSIVDTIGWVIRMLPVVAIFWWIAEKYGGDFGMIYSKLMETIPVVYSKVMETIQSFRALRYTGPEP